MTRIPNTRIAPWLGLLLATGGCAPLQQAPLVYSSKVAIGIDVAANVAENQGGSITIGVKTVDAAYVPVAVSRLPGSPDGKTPAGSAKDEIIPIVAQYGDSNSADASDPTAGDERNRKIDRYLTALQAATDAGTSVANAEASLASINSQISQLEALKANIGTTNAMPVAAPAPADAASAATSQREAAFQQRNDELNKVNADFKLTLPTLLTSNVPAVINAIDLALKSSKQAKADTESQVQSLRGQRQAKADEATRAKAEAVRLAGLSKTSKTDAMSVYGRFDANGGGGTKEGASANILVGKVFSTGLASQNLTEAVKLEASSRCLTSGFELAKTLTPDASRLEFVKSLAKMCEPKTGNGK